METLSKASEADSFLLFEFLSGVIQPNDRDSRGSNTSSIESEESNVCDLCKLTFNDEISLAEHTKEHIQCLDCNLRFGSKTDFIQHSKSSHNILQSEGGSLIENDLADCETDTSKTGTTVTDWKTKPFELIKGGFEWDFLIEPYQDNTRTSPPSADRATTSEASIIACTEPALIYLELTRGNHKLAKTYAEYALTHNEAPPTTIKPKRRRNGINGLKKPNKSESQPVNEFNCPICDMGFKYRYKYKKHVKAHTSADPSATPQIDPIDASKSSALESDELKCPDCGRIFKHGSSLSKHTKLNHKTKVPKERNFVCNVCSKRYGRRSHLIRHCSNSCILRPYKCSRCPRTFRVESALDVHQKRHVNFAESEIKVYNCRYCGLEFYNNMEFMSHQRIHDPINVSDQHNQVEIQRQVLSQEIVCKLCDRVSRSMDDFRVHILLHVGI